jgi:hypothetical protein
VTGVFLIANIPIVSRHSFLPLSLIISVFIISIYIAFKYSIFERFKKINMEIDEIEQLDKEGFASGEYGLPLDTIILILVY